MRTALAVVVIFIGCGARTPLDEPARADGGADGVAPSPNLCPPPPAPLTNDGTQPNAPNPTLELESARGGVSWLPGPEEDAHLAWSFAWSGDGTSQPAIDRDGRIYALETESVTAVEPSGKIAWSHPVPGNIGGTATIGADGNIHTIVDDFFEGMCLETFSPSGKLVSRIDLPGASADSIAIGSDGVVYTGGSDSGGWLPATVYAVSEGASPLLTLAPYDVTSAPALGDHMVYVVANGYMLYAVSTSGALSWKRTIEAAPLPLNLRMSEYFPNVAAAAVSKDGTIYAIGAYGHLRAFSPAGVELWSFQAPVDPSCNGADDALDCRIAAQPPIITETQIVWPDLAGDVHAVALDGTLRWTRHVGTNDWRTVLAVDDNETIYWVATTQGGALSKDGADLFSWPSDGAPNGVAITFGETAVVATSSKMYAIQSARCAN